MSMEPTTFSERQGVKARSGIKDIIIYHEATIAMIDDRDSHRIDAIMENRARYLLDDLRAHEAHDVEAERLRAEKRKDMADRIYTSLPNQMVGETGYWLLSREQNNELIRVMNELKEPAKAISELEGPERRAPSEAKE